MPMDVDKRVLPNLDGDIFAFAVQDPDIDRNDVLEIDRDWKVKVSWHVTGPGAHLLTGSDWHVMIKIESMGPEEEKTLKTVTVAGNAYTAGSTPTHVDYVVDIPIQARIPGNPQPDRINQEGVYRLVAVITHDKTGGFPGPDRVAGFREGPMLQFYAFQ
jgi:hypothetical protein